MVKGYKCFNKDMTNTYGFKFEVGKTYKVDGEIHPGTNGNGFHLSTNIEDTFRFCGVMNPDIVLCEVIGSGEVVSFNDEYNGYYEMYAVEKLEIVRQLDRNEIIQMALNMSEERAMRFVQVFKLTQDEIKLFEDKFSDYIFINLALEYYQKGNKSIYQEHYSNSRRR